MDFAKCRVFHVLTTSKLKNHGDDAERYNAVVQGLKEIGEICTAVELLLTEASSEKRDWNKVRRALLHKSPAFFVQQQALAEDRAAEGSDEWWTDTYRERYWQQRSKARLLLLQHDPQAKLAARLARDDLLEGLVEAKPNANARKPRRLGPSAVDDAKKQPAAEGAIEQHLRQRRRVERAMTGFGRTNSGGTGASPPRGARRRPATRGRAEVPPQQQREDRLMGCDGWKGIHIGREAVLSTIETPPRTLFPDRSRASDCWPGEVRAILGGSSDFCVGTGGSGGG
ncbi:unnamed protein product, partial [Phaeothamnion confervicola]